MLEVAVALILQTHLWLTGPLIGNEPIAIRRDKVSRIVTETASRSGTRSGRAVRASTEEHAAILEIVRKESTYDPRAKNRTSTSSTLNGFLNSTWGLKSVGMQKTTDAHLQIEAMFRYIDGRYSGVPTKALAHHRRKNYY